MTPNNFKCNDLMPLHVKGLTNVSASVWCSWLDTNIQPAM